MTNLKRWKMTKKELEKLIKEYKSKYIYQRNNGELFKYEVIDDNTLIEVKTGITFDLDKSIMLGKVSSNIIDLIEEGDIISFNFKGGEYITEVIDFVEGTTHYLDVIFSPIDGDAYSYSIYDEDIEITSILTKEQFEEGKFCV